MGNMGTLPRNTNWILVYENWLYYVQKIYNICIGYINILAEINPYISKTYRLAGTTRFALSYKEHKPSKFYLGYVKIYPGIN